MSKKKGLKGFADLSYFPLTLNSDTAYTPGTAAPLIGARSCTVEDTRTEYRIPGDDGIYAQGSDYESTTLTIGVNEMELKDLAALTGAEFEETPGELTESDLDNAPEVALSFSALMLDGGYRMFQYLNAKLVNYKADLRAKLDTGNEVNQYQLTFLCSARKAMATGENKPAIRITKDAADASGLTWLATIAAIPAP